MSSSLSFSGWREGPAADGDRSRTLPLVTQRHCDTLAQMAWGASTTARWKSPWSRMGMSGMCGKSGISGWGCAAATPAALCTARPRGRFAGFWRRMGSGWNSSLVTSPSKSVTVRWGNSSRYDLSSSRSSKHVPGNGAKFDITQITLRSDFYSLK